MFGLTTGKSCGDCDSFSRSYLYHIEQMSTHGPFAGFRAERDALAGFSWKPFL